MCLHGTDIAGASIDDVFKIVAIIDFGWDNGKTKYLNRMYGDYKGKTSAYEETTYAAQLLGYLGYALNDTKEFVYQSGTERPMYSTYKLSLTYILDTYDYIVDKIKKVSGIKITGVEETSGRR